MANRPTPSSQGAKSGQVPVSDIKRFPSSSNVKGGQVPVKQETRGIRDGNWNARGCVSPLGNTDSSYSGDMSKMEERNERPTMIPARRIIKGY